MSTSPGVEEVALHCSDGIVIRGQRWRTSSRRRKRHSDGGHHKIVIDSIPIKESPATSTTSSSSRDGAVPHGPACSSDDVLRVLCIHGFMDNCRSFSQLAPKIVDHFQNNDVYLEKNGRRLNHSRASNADREDQVDLVAFDFPGHGRSSHKSRDATPTLVVSDCVHYVAEVVSQLGWKNQGLVLVGHSMGGIVALMYAASFPSHVQKLFLLDAYGPDHAHPESVTARIRRHVQERYDYNKDQIHKMADGGDGRTSTATPSTFPTKVHRSLDSAVATRLQTARLSPGGHQWISDEAARELVQRATRSVHQPWGPFPDITRDGDKTDYHRSDDGNYRRTGRGGRGAIQFIHDNRLKHHHLMVHTLEQVDGYWDHLRCPVYCLVAQEGWPFPRAWTERANRLITPPSFLTVHVLPGSHHFHADPATADSVADTIVSHLCWDPIRLLADDRERVGRWKDHYR
jgi:pimeloyl-ACP methyl ester carboxylesterase